MSTDNQSLASTPRWLVRFNAQFVGGFVVYAIALIAFSSVALIAMNQLLPSAVPFMILALVSYTIRLIGNDPDGESFEESEEFENMSTNERRLFYLTVVIILTTGMSLPVIVFGLIGVGINQSLSLGFVAAGAAFLLPYVDAWAGKKLDYNLQALGAYIGLYGMRGLALIYRISPEVPIRAGILVEELIYQEFSGSDFSDSDFPSEDSSF